MAKITKKITEFLRAATATQRGLSLKKSAVRYNGPSGQAIADGVDTIINFDTKHFDTGNNVTTGTSWKFTSSQAGYYRISAYATLNGTVAFNGTTNILGLVLYKNGDSYSTDERRPYASERYARMSITDTIYLSVGDYIDVRVAVAIAGVNLSPSPFAHRINIDMIEEA